MKLELISFALCPFVQRSVITLKFKRADFVLTHIDLKNRPSWFAEISPMGKVPVLRVDDQHSIFESAVINEFIDETVGQPLMPADPLQKALERAWIEFGSEMLRECYMMTIEKDRSEVEKRVARMFAGLAKIESQLREGPYFRGGEFSLVDAAWAPLFIRLWLSETIRQHPQWSVLPKVRDWVEALHQVPAVQESMSEDLRRQYIEYCRALGSLIY